ncbi:MAG: Fis family transcriptional regulator [bacterium]|nr:MAG: Fis family transcriptional regulator [bacterium]
MDTILIVDDDVACLALMEIALVEEGYKVITANNGDEAFKLFQVNSIDLVISDVAMPSLNGDQLLQAIKRYDSKVEVILVTGDSSLDAAARAVINGAYDYLSKPVNLDELVDIVKSTLTKRRALKISEKAHYPTSSYSNNQLVGNSRAMLDLFKMIGKVAPSDSTVLILGESGTGKELLARQIHKFSKRSNKKFVAVNCGALTESLLESELFGHVRGAFTGAVAERNGLFKEADGGTIFLDEVTETSLAFQMKLLRVLQEGEILPVGTSTPRRVDVRVVAATNQDIDSLVEAKRFRMDLLYRLRVITLNVPPLRERQEDIALLAQFFVKKYTPTNRMPSPLSDEIIDFLQCYDWPGNVRELENAIESAVILSGNSMITMENLPEKIYQSKNKNINKSDVYTQLGVDSVVPLADMQYQYIKQVLDFVSGNKSRAARLLQIDRKTLDRIVTRSTEKLS